MDEIKLIKKDLVRKKLIVQKNLFIIIVLGVLLIGLVNSIGLPTGGVSYCCEKTVAGAWCQNSPKDNCNIGIDPKTNSVFRAVASNCESLSYCKMGTCINSQEGTCMENTPQRVCDENKGVWSEKPVDEVPQCSLGCCLIGDQAAFVTQTRCKRLSLLYGLETNFRTDISNEVQCVLSASSDAKGACVFEKEYETTCKFTTKRECLDMMSSDSSVNFHEGYLCSDETLGTNCGPSQKTTCVEGRDEVFFLDSCGNLANVYDSSKAKDMEYWSRVYDVGASCNSGQSNADSATCGNCDYYLGSTCKAFKRGEDKVKPNIGNNICRDLSCEYKGKTYSHGETWCDNSEGADKNLPGSKYFRLVCYDGDVTVEPCADFRQEVCEESQTNGFKVAACVVNMWQDCASQDTKEDCENIDRRDCQWVAINGTSESGYQCPLLGAVGVSTTDTVKFKGGGCVPKNPPGFDFWNSAGEAEGLCNIASATCTVTYEAGISGSESCVSGCECLTQAWEDSMNKMCTNLGDCGSKLNFIGVQGFQNKSAITREDVDEEEDSGGGGLF